MRRPTLHKLCLRCPLAADCNDRHPACLVAAHKRAQKRLSWHGRKARQAQGELLRMASANRRAMQAAPIRNGLSREEAA